MKRFDRKFGADFLSGLPQSPAVYLFKDEAGDVLYAGKAKNIRRRLSGYRNASRRKAHRKMRTLVREAHCVEVRLQVSEAEALLVENQLIRELRPPYNVEGAFDFLYPAIGTGHHRGRLVLCLTSEPELFESLALQWHGTFRPRWRARRAFDSLVALFGRLGHLEPRSRLPISTRRKGTRLVAVRRVPSMFLTDARRFLDGEDAALLAALCTGLLESHDARQMAAQVEEELRFLEDFYRDDARRLLEARRAVGWPHAFVPRAERDGLFIRARAGSALEPCAPTDASAHA